MSGCYQQLTLADRRLLHRFVEQKLAVNEMARRLGRHRSTIYREIRRNTFHDKELPEYTGYFGTIADELRRERRRRLRKLRRHADLRAEVISQLEARWSPEQIAGRLLSEGISPVRVSAETIYRFIYSKEDYELGLYRYLPEARRKRRPLGSRKPRDGAFPASHRISQRPDFIGNRSRFGHWEGDLIIFERPFGHANVTSLIERKSRYTVLIKNPSRHSRPIMDKIVRTFSSLPAFARQSFTFDRGTEFAAFRALEDGIGARSWFCDPSAPWQKGAVENANKRIRRFLPSNTDLSQMSQAMLNQITRILNNQPRKCLGYRTPTEAFMAHLHGEV
ncbi:IS30 family transposase (plasmid) [Agrobacterium salinitolerans]|uniref:IS30 family transposase n=1 Tax=Agrobacterium salinitolerans TaxID=1183413 RepID=A0A4Z1R1L3_9HYPH|nr:MULTISPECIES: IS30 family transposase [Agrobacterium]MDH6298118.1 IS30 family transposase [Agrobacterium fabrum]UYZ11068.1 IS30 family transposase [Agrobacterium salinitolerans]